MMLPFLPWCRLDRAYSVGDITITPYRGSVEGADSAVQKQIARVLATYRTIEGRPVDHAAVVRYSDKPFGADVTADEADGIYDWIQLACFAGLAGRQFLTPEAQCNSDVFQLYMQRFKEGDFDVVTLRTRRRDGHTWAAWPLDLVASTVPSHVSPVRSVSLDQRLLDGLVAYVRSGSSDWDAWQNALSCFNQGNTDSSAFRHQVEWGLLASAFERLLDAEPRAEDVADKFANAVVPTKPLLTAQAKRRIDRWKDPAVSVRYEWLKEFYRVRGDFSHGNFRSRQPMAWPNPLEHLTLAAIAFPLLVRCLLQRAGAYALSRDDRVNIETFEPFADQPTFLAPPPDSRGSLDTWWTRMWSDAKWRL
jgi:hypothetical protein